MSSKKTIAFRWMLKGFKGVSFNKTRVKHRAYIQHYGGLFVNVLSLFDGISAARVALDRAGVRIDRYLASEIKPHAVKMAQAMYPDTEQLGDVTRIDFSTLPPIDIIIFGSPCQDLSCANSERKGLGGERSGLFFKAVEAIRICKPRWFLMENVASMKPSEKEKISRALGGFYANDLLGIYCEPIRINSSLVSAQMRDRLYWCNWRVSQPKDKGVLLQDVLERDGEALEEKSYALTASYKMDAEFRRQRTFIRQRAHGFNKGGVFEEKSPTLTASGDFADNNHIISTAQKEKAFVVATNDGCDKNRPLTASYREKAGIAELIKVGNIKNDSISCRVYSPEGKAASQNANGGGQGCKTGLYQIGENVRKLTPRECCRLQTYDERIFEYFTIRRPPQRYKANEAVKPDDGKATVIRGKEVNPEWVEYRKTTHKPYMSKSSFYNVFGDSFTVDVIVHILQCNKEMTRRC
jgi:DNA (cytosine-5)-methyltransferase 3A